MPLDWTPLQDLVRRHERFLLTSHMRPDCDALGSELGLGAILEKLGKQVLILNGDATPRHLQFIDPAKRIKVLGRDVQPDQLADYEVLIVLDTSAWAQLGAMADVLRSSQAEKLVIDHHVSEDDLGAIALKDPQAEATGRLVIDAADALGVELTAEIAEPLFAAIATDTGWFRFPSVTGDTFRAAGRLVDAGTEPQAIYSALYEQESIGRVLLRGRILANAQTDLGGRLVHAEVTQADFQAVGAQPADTEDVINMLLRVVGTEVALMFVELSGSVKVSYRSRGGVDVRTIAEQFGGGGHNAAAGSTVPGTLEEVRTRILDAVRQAMQ